jgi:hypothetical protein
VSAHIFEIESMSNVNAHVIVLIRTLPFGGKLKMFELRRRVRIHALESRLQPIFMTLARQSLLFGDVNFGIRIKPNPRHDFNAGHFRVPRRRRAAETSTGTSVLTRRGFRLMLTGKI